jgi:DNA-binding NarL/FixJ family response regulator
VKSHVTAIFTKLNASDRAGAVARGFDLGLLQIDPRAAR